MRMFPLLWQLAKTIYWTLFTFVSGALQRASLGRTTFLPTSMDEQIENMQDDDTELNYALEMSLEEERKKQSLNRVEPHVSRIEEIDEDTPQEKDQELEYALKLSTQPSHPKRRSHVAALHEEELLKKALKLSQQEDQLRREAEARRLFREQQDLEYELSLARDKAKEDERRAKENEEHAREREIRLKEEEQQNMREIMRKKEQNLEAEPSDNQKVAFLGVRLPNNGRLTRRFTIHTKLSKVKDWIDCEFAKEEKLTKLLGNYDLVIGFPNRIAEDDNATLEELHLFPRALISVQSRL